MRHILGDELTKERNHAAPGANHIAVADHRKLGSTGAGQVVSGDENLVGREFGRTVKIDRVGRLVGRQGDDALDPLAQGRLDDVFGPMNVGHDTFERIVLGQRHMFHRRRVHYIIDIPHGQL